MLQDILNKSIPVWQAVTLGIAFIVVHNLTRPLHGKKIAEIHNTSTSATTPAETSQIEEALNSEEKEVLSDDDYDDPYDPDLLFYDEPYPIRDDFTLFGAPYKMLFCINMELKMGKGKIAAQTGHATMGAYKIARKHCQSALKAWERTGVAKIVVKCEVENEMHEIYKRAKEAKIVAYIVQDAGRTQIAAGSKTVLVLGPAPASIIDPICQHLKLL